MTAYWPAHLCCILFVIRTWAGIWFPCLMWIKNRIYIWIVLCSSWNVAFCSNLIRNNTIARWFKKLASNVGDLKYRRVWVRCIFSCARWSSRYDLQHRARKRSRFAAGDSLYMSRTVCTTEPLSTTTYIGRCAVTRPFSTSCQWSWWGASCNKLKCIVCWHICTTIRSITIALSPCKCSHKKSSN